jgi:hypothetical protein
MASPYLQIRNDTTWILSGMRSADLDILLIANNNNTNIANTVAAQYVQVLSVIYLFRGPDAKYIYHFPSI